MPRNPDFIFAVQIRIPEAFTLDSIVRNPRTFKPKDVLSACQNNELILKHGKPPQPVISLATYLMTEFFAISHGTGLYNRQTKLWESLSQVNAIHVYQLTTGVFRKTQLPIFDFHFLDYKNKPLIVANLVTQIPTKSKPENLLKAFIGRAQQKSALTGVIACFPAPVPGTVIAEVRNQTATDDAIARYEAIMPSVKASFDLLSMNTANLTELSNESAGSGELRTVFSLLHPDLLNKPQITEPTKVMRKVMPKPKGEQAESDKDLLEQEATTTTTTTTIDSD